MAMTPEAKKALSSTIRGLRQRLLEDLRLATESAYRLSVRAQDAGLDEAARTKRQRLDSWLDEQLRAQAAGGRRRQREDFLREAEQQAAYTLLNRLVILRLMEEPGPSGQPLRKPALIKGGWGSTAYQDFRDLARGVVRDDPTEGFGFLLQLVFEELAEDLPGLFGSAGIGDLIPIPPATLRHAVEELSKDELESCWADDMTLGWVYQYWNDPERERLDAKINDGGKIEPHEIASKTQMFTERYMVDWMLQNSLGLMWFTLCKKNGWAPEVQTNGTLQRLEERRVEWRAKRSAGEVSLTALMPLETEEEQRWAYFLPGQEIPDEAVELAPHSVRDWKILDPAVGSGHFLVVALGLLLALFQEEARHRGLQDAPEWSQKAIVEHLLAHTLYGIDIDPRAVQIAAASLWLKGKALCPEIEPEQLNLVAPNLRLADLPDDDPALAELRSDIEAETGISGEFTSQILQALRGADHLGSLLKIDQAVDAVIDQQERRLKALRTKAQQVQADLFGGAPPVQEEMDFSAAEARADIQELLEQFLSHHSSAYDLGLRLQGEQLASGVRFTRLLKEDAYHLVIANPPYQGTGRIESNGYVELHYSLGKADLYAAFLLRGLELAKPGGFSAMLTMRGWMFIKQYSALREGLLSTSSLRLLLDLSSGAFEEISAAQVVVSVASSIFQRSESPLGPALALKIFDEKFVTSAGEVTRKRAASLAQQDLFRFQAHDLKAVPEWPLIYWWDSEKLSLYQSAPLIGDVAPARQGLATADNARFLRKPWEPTMGGDRWQPFIKGAEGRAWVEPLNELIDWRNQGLAMRSFERAVLRNPEYYFRLGVAFSMIGANFSARVHRYPSIIDVMGSSIYTEDLAGAVCAMNSSSARMILQSLNPGVHFQGGDVNRLPLFHINSSDLIFEVVERSFTAHEAHREPSPEFLGPGPSPWHSAQDWAQQAVDRPARDSLPEYVEELDPEPPTDHLSFALGVALGRFAPVDDEGQPTTSNQPGVLDPSTDDLSHALPAGILFLDGSLEENDHRDDLGTAAAAPLHQAWYRHGSAIAPTRSLRDWLRLDFFKDVHKGMYENRPIQWPLSSSGKTFVVWVNIHRMDERTLKVLLADHLIPARSRIDGELDDLRQVRDSEDRKAAREADSRIGKLSRWREELHEFISAVEHCAERGAPPTDGRCPAREQDAVYAPDPDDGVMINSAALWPLLEPQWKDPKKWWKELASAQGKKDYDWAHLAMRYWPSRVDEKCQNDPSLAVAHGCFWRYHPERAWAWELRLQQEIGPDFRIAEAPYRPGGRDLGDQGDAPHRQAWLAAHPSEALAAVEKEAIRRMGRGDNRQVVNEMRILESGLWSVIPEKVSAMEQRLSDRQGQLFSLRAPDEAEGRAGTDGEQSVQVGLALALGGAEGAGG
ncbi:BREX-6 system adenine-specific DNA-methyltransferase PglX [Synechococcus sp. CCAP 1479/9]|uniref:BREX-6 system adenine-specific DNA-methyltransferase PglX n=1 Tax=Synechococcus sp. CCAP 1479/9 TaxID=1221593 RepID=UPI001C21D685|nr:BREX-6 system adenine-specific DNA-methyltransferase PglX [Synechococcus sp. CCAP 1479/9]